MPYLDQLFAPEGIPAWQGAQCYEAIVVATDPAYVVLPTFDRNLRWGPCEPADAAVKVGDAVSVSQSEQGVLWLLGLGGGGGGAGGNIDGGFPDSVFGGVPNTDGGTVS
jgi:hypothetical protein